MDFYLDVVESRILIMKSIGKLFDPNYILRKVCMINYDGDQCIKKNEVPKSKSRILWEFESLLGVRRINGSVTGIDREEAC